MEGVDECIGASAENGCVTTRHGRIAAELLGMASELEIQES